MGAKSPARIARRSYLQSQTKFMNHHESPKLSGEPWSNPTLWSCFWTWKTGRICKNRPGIPASIHARWCPTKFHPKSCGDEKLKRSVRESFNGRDLAWETLLSHRIFGDLEVKTHTHTTGDFRHVLGRGLFFHANMCVVCFFRTHKNEPNSTNKIKEVSLICPTKHMTLCGQKVYNAPSRHLKASNPPHSLLAAKEIAMG